jgi:outer membrane protein OmpA-like peptidoglycan-associated protein
VYALFRKGSHGCPFVVNKLLNMVSVHCGMKWFLIFIVTYLTVNVVAAQQQYNKRSVELYEQALLLVRDDAFRQSIPTLQASIKADTTYYEPYLTLAGVYGELKVYDSAVIWFDKVMAFDTIHTGFFYLPYSINLAGLGKFKEALTAVNKFLEQPKLSERSRQSGLARKANFEFAVAMQQQYAAIKFAPINLGDSINSIYSEYYPSITLDDSLFVFTRRAQGVRENFMSSVLTPEQHAYGKAGVIDGSINEEPSKGAINISQDGEWLVFAGNFGHKGYGNFDIYMSQFTPTGWSEAFNLGPQVNTDFYESGPTLSPDKMALYFVSDRPGGYGGKDIYVSYRKANGSWSEAQNLGATINTAGDELAPMMHADGQTLFFCSNGLPGYGNMDLFLVRKDTTGQWMKPQNLGYPINTIDHEGSIFVAGNGKDAYYASDRADSRGGLDIYRFELPEHLRPARTLYTKGFVKDAVTKKGLPSRVVLINQQTRKVISSVQTDEEGYYFVTLPVGTNYQVSVRRKGYWFYTKPLLYAQGKADTSFFENIYLRPITLGSKLVVDNILFDNNQVKLTTESILALDQVWQLLNENPTLSLQINGYTDSVGNKKANLLLSEQRARAVVSYLVRKGIVPERLRAKGFGDTMPIAPNATEKGRALNRRTELEVIGM